MRTRSEASWSTTGVDARHHEPGDRIGEYIVLESIGAGGMGIVYAAYDPKLDRKIALKLLHDDGADEGATVGRLRLLAEGRALARVAHPNIVAVYDVGKIDDDAIYIAMELVDGQTLKQWRDASPRGWEEIIVKFVDIAAGLVAVHDADMVHRDVKPDNILIDGAGRARVTDFGLARPHEHAPPSLARAEQDLVSDSSRSVDLQLTRTGAKIGTPAYMASEQLQGGAATASSDQFAFCVALWECLYGERPFEGGSWVSLVMEVSEGRVRAPPPPPSGRPVPMWIRRTVERGLHADPALRWPSMQALREALQAGDPLRRRKRVGLGIATLAIAGLGAGAVQARRTAQDARAEAACATAAQRAHETWSGDARTGLRDHLQASKLDNAKELAEGVVTLFDAYAQNWAREYEAACLAKLEERASPVGDDLLDRRTECLDTRLSTTDALVQRLRQSPDALLSRAQYTVETSTNLDACTDDARLQRKPALPTDPSARERVRDLNRTLSSTQLHEHLGDYQEGLRISEAALAQARDTAHGPLIANGLYRVAVFEEKLGNYTRAVDRWVEAFHEAAISDDELLAGETAMSLAFAEGYQLERYAAGRRWAELAGTYTTRMDMKQTLFEARRLDVLAVMHEMQGDLDDSVRIHRRSIALRRSLVPATHQSLGYGMANLAGVLQARGELEEAETALLESKKIFENAFGPDNPTTAHVLDNLANLYIKMERYDEANALLGRVEKIWTKRLGPEHPDVGDTHLSYGDIAFSQGDLDGALTSHTRALEIYLTAYDQPHGDVVRSTLRVAEDHLLRGEWDRARTQFERVVEQVAKLDRRRDRGRAEYGLGTLALLRGETERARARFERAAIEFASLDEPPKSWQDRVRVGSAAVELAHLRSPQKTRAMEAMSEDTTLDTRARAVAAAWSMRFGHPSATQPRARLDALVRDAAPSTAHLVAVIAPVQPSLSE